MFYCLTDWELVCGNVHSYLEKARKLQGNEGTVQERKIDEDVYNQIVEFLDTHDTL